MTTVSIVFSNSNDQPFYIQVDPWAGLYVLKQGEKIEIIAETENSSPSFSIDESGSMRILSLWSDEYYVVLNGQRIHWSKYPLDSRLCAYCLRPLNLEDVCEVLGNACACGRFPLEASAT